MAWPRSPSRRGSHAALDENGGLAAPSCPGSRGPASLCILVGALSHNSVHARRRQVHSPSQMCAERPLPHAEGREAPALMGIGGAPAPQSPAAVSDRTHVRATTFLPADALGWWPHLPAVGGLFCGIKDGGSSPGFERARRA